MSSAIVHAVNRYKRPPRKRKPNPAALAIPVIVHARSPKPGNLPPRPKAPDQAKAASAPAKDDRKSAIITARRPGKVLSVPAGLLPDTPEEHRRRGDAADALWREMKRRIAEKLRRDGTRRQAA